MRLAWMALALTGYVYGGLEGEVNGRPQDPPEKVCYSAEFNAQWSNVVEMGGIPSGTYTESSYSLPVVASGIDPLQMATVSVGPDKYYSLFPSGTRNSRLHVRETKFIWGKKQGADAGDYCFSWRSGSWTPKENIGIVNCVGCIQSGDFGWQMKIYSKKPIQAAQKMRNPVVVVQGFDFGFGGDESSSMTFQALEKAFNTLYDAKGVEVPGERLLDRLVSEGVEVIFVKFKNPSADLNNQGENLVEALKKISEFTEKTSPIYLIGPSMGGQVARIALGKIATRSGDQRIENLKNQISGAILFDSPNLGASIPASVFFALRKNSDFDPQSYTFWRNTSSEAARQMLVMYGNGDVWEKNPVSQDFYTGLNSATSLARQSLNGRIDLIGIGSGSGAGMNQGLPKNTRYFHGSKPIIQFDKTIDEVTALFPVAEGYRIPVIGEYILTGFHMERRVVIPKTTISVNLTMYNSLYTGVDLAADGNVAYAWWTDGIFQTSNGAVAKANFDLENAPGGYFPMFKILRESLGGVYKSSPGEVEGNVVNSSFVPSISAAGLIQKSVFDSTHLMSPVNTSESRASILTRSYLPTQNQLHTSLSSENVGWILQEFSLATKKWKYRRISPSLNLLQE